MTDYPGWVLDDEVKIAVTKLHDGNYQIEEVNGDLNRKVTISYSSTGRMLFDGEDIETEEFINFVGLLDYVDEVPLRVVYLDGETG
jgi:hypothetical protein